MQEQHALSRVERRRMVVDAQDEGGLARGAFDSTTRATQRRTRAVLALIPVRVSRGRFPALVLPALRIGCRGMKSAGDLPLLGPEESGHLGISLRWRARTIACDPRPCNLNTSEWSMLWRRV